MSCARSLLSFVSMKVYSFIKDQYNLLPIEVEVSCVNGTAEFEIMGQADSLIKECKQKIFSAFRNCNFELPSSKRIFVNLRPSYIRKSSQGLDLAIALAILWELKQLSCPVDTQKTLIYGELGLDGSVFTPDDIAGVLNLPEGFDHLITGLSHEKLMVPSYGISRLNQFSPEENVFDEAAVRHLQVAPNVDDIYVSKELAELMKAICIGEHSCLFAGPKGSGKSTVVENLAKMLRPLEEEEFFKVRQINQYFGESIQWRPIVAPHHTSTVLAMVGGGARALPGEFTRAHGGVLLLDEYLEFPVPVQEALREPMETGSINVSRLGGRKVHPADFLLMATTNLCPCGEYFPSKKHRCICRLSLRRRYVEKLSGPVLDRFHILCFAENWAEKEEVSLLSLQKELQELYLNRSKTKSVKSFKESELLKDFDSKFDLENLSLLSKSSRRRKIACLQLAKSFALANKREQINRSDFDKAMRYSFRSFESLRWEMHRDL